jgi:low-density lipoprotein receptor-related protein 4
MKALKSDKSFLESFLKALKLLKALKIFTNPSLLSSFSSPIGLTLLEDQKTCTSTPDKLMLIARKKDIRMRQLDSRNPMKEIDMVIPLDNLKSTIALDWCSETDRIYWSDVGKSTINRAHLNGSNQETVIQDGLVSPAGLALDWISNKLYWTDAGTNRIEVSTLDGHVRALLVWQNLAKPRDIVVNPLQGLMFWSDWSDSPLIERADMDGSQRTRIVAENLLYPNGLAIDFVDAGTKALEFVNFDGTGRNRLIADGLQHPFGIDVYEKNIYWSDWDLQSILMSDKHSGKNRKSVITDTSDLMDIRVFHRKRKVIRNPCGIRNGGCSHICLLNQKSFSCACPIGVKLTENNRTCKEQPSSYIIFAHRTDIRQVSLDIVSIEIARS